MAINSYEIRGTIVLFHSLFSGDLSSLFYFLLNSCYNIFVRISDMLLLCPCEDKIIIP
jgi:hypothetical protein